MKRFLLLLALCGSWMTGQAQPTVQTDLGVALVSSYIWCGQKLDNASVQPHLSVSYKGFTLEGWGSVGLDADSHAGEFDLFLSYQYRQLEVSLIDYWLEYAKDDAPSHYFDFSSRSARSAHVYNAAIAYDFGRFSASVNTNIGGKDGHDAEGNRAYSTYFRIQAPFTLGGLEWNAVVGGTPWETTYYQAHGFAITEARLAATKQIPVNSKWQLPLTVAATWNPRTEKVYFTAKINI